MPGSQLLNRIWFNLHTMHLLYKQIEQIVCDHQQTYTYQVDTDNISAYNRYKPSRIAENALALYPSDGSGPPSYD